MSKFIQWTSNMEERGFALVEALVVSSVFVFGFVAANKVQVKMIKESQLSIQKSQAAQLTNQKLEQIRNYSDLSGYNGISSEINNINAGNNSYIDSLTVTSLAQYKKLDQSIQWTNSSGESQSVSLSSFISENDPRLSGLLFSSNYNSTPLPSPGAGLSNNTIQDSAASTTSTGTTTDVTVPGTDIVLTYDENNKVIEINHNQAVTLSGTITLNTGASAPPDTVNLSTITLIAQTSNTAVITCSYSGPTGIINCIMGRGWSGSILLGGTTTTNVCVSNQQPYSNLLVSLSNQNYLLSNVNELCPAQFNYLLQTL